MNRSSNILRTRSAVAVLAAAAVVGVSTPSAEAGWLSWVSVLVTGVGIGAACTPTGVGQVVGGVCGVAEVAGVAYDAYQTLTGPPPAPPPKPKPTNAGGTAPGTITQGASAQMLPPGPFPRPPWPPTPPKPFPIPNPPLPPFPNGPWEGIASASDSFMSAFDGLLSAMHKGQDQTPHLNAVANSLDGVADAIAASIGDYTLSQSDINGLPAYYAAHGLPPIEQDILDAMGVSPEAVAEYTQFHVDFTPQLEAGMSFSLVGGFHDMADQFRPVPAPGSAALLALGGLLVARRRR